MKTAWFLLIALITTNLLSGCKTDVKNGNPDNKMQSPELHIVHLDTDTRTLSSPSRFLMVYKDGSYVVSDEQKSIIYINPSPDDEMEDGIIATLDENGLPEIIQCKDYTILCGNFQDNRLDAIILHGTDEPVYLWGLKMDVDADLLTDQSRTRAMSLGTEITIAWAVKGVAMVAMTTTAVMGAGAAIAGASVATAGIALSLAMLGITTYACNLYLKGQHTGMAELENLGVVASLGSLADWKNAALNGKVKLELPKGWGAADLIIGAVDEFINSWLDDIDKRMQKTIDDVQKPFDYRPYQLNLSSYAIEMPIIPATAVINVTTLSTDWRIETENMGWCVAKKTDDKRIDIEVFEAYTGNNRQATFKICRYPQDDKIPPVYFSVAQTGVDIEISPQILYFDPDGKPADGETTGFIVKSLFGMPTIELEEKDKEWCGIQSVGLGSYLVTVQPNTGKDRCAVVSLDFGEAGKIPPFVVRIYQEGKPYSFTASPQEILCDFKGSTTPLSISTDAVIKELKCLDMNGELTGDISIFDKMTRKDGDVNVLECGVYVRYNDVHVEKIMYLTVILEYDGKIYEEKITVRQDPTPEYKVELISGAGHIYTSENPSCYYVLKVTDVNTGELFDADDISFGRDASRVIEGKNGIILYGYVYTEVDGNKTWNYFISVEYANKILTLHNAFPGTEEGWWGYEVKSTVFKPGKIWIKISVTHPFIGSTYIGTKDVQGSPIELDTTYEHRVHDDV